MGTTKSARSSVWAGWGGVYRAYDTKLQREVALKVLPEAFARDPDGLARFRREARLLASLNHPNIAAIYGLEDIGDTHFLVMELVLGDTLRDQIARDGPVAVEEALTICKQIAEALEHAHEKTIIHRDLKPANVKVTPEGMVKVLDFGLAKAFAGDESETDIHNAPTLSASPTIPGVIPGTPAYMSPEQAKGKKVDRRTDIWALGCVLYELLTGQGAFHTLHPSRDRKGAVAFSNEPPLAGARGSDAENAETVQEIIARVLQAEPDWSALPETTPHGIRVLLRRCLHKDVTQRFHSAADVRIQIEESLAAPASWSPDGKWLAFTDTSPTVGSDIWMLRVEGERPQREAPKPQPFLRTSFNEGVPRFSPDGRWLASASNESGRFEVYVQPFPGPGGKWQISTEGGGGLGSGPRWARNGRELFYSNGNTMMVVDIKTEPAFTAGKPKLLFEGQFASGGDVSPDGQRFLMIQAVEPAQPATQIHMVLNWLEELKRRVPVPE